MCRFCRPNQSTAARAGGLLDGISGGRVKRKPKIRAPGGEDWQLKKVQRTDVQNVKSEKMATTVAFFLRFAGRHRSVC